ncbi:hypothetical protein NDU88_007393 [Pleurodeles waltl]|uniref:Clp R domain-containing protein n=1 Tax=Pleurodeles waltl TaxID=8319 RepID=A0AAV7QNX7_PLEWA|nr:hypothetical protein NDU88_007393 [Pleurodeles waltl]
MLPKSQPKPVAMSKSPCSLGQPTQSRRGPISGRSPSVARRPNPLWDPARRQPEPKIQGGRSSHRAFRPVSASLEPKLWHRGLSDMLHTARLTQAADEAGFCRTVQGSTRASEEHILLAILCRPRLGN